MGGRSRKRRDGVVTSLRPISLITQLIMKKLSLETRKKISEAQKGKKHSKETKQKISENRKGKDLGNTHGFKRGSIPWNKGKPWSKNIKLKVSKSRTGKCLGKQNPAWIEDRTKLSNRQKYGIWRQQVLKRDRFKCIWCGNEEKLEADHILPKTIFPEIMFELINGRTLCAFCHSLTDTYKNKKGFREKYKLLKQQAEREKLNYLTLLTHKMVNE